MPWHAQRFSKELHNIFGMPLRIYMYNVIFIYSQYYNVYIGITPM